MRLLHLSDLHLGKTLGGLSLIEDQRAMLSGLLGMIDAEQPDAVLVAGDVYDRAAPAEEAVHLADWWISEVAARGVPLCITSGNHDSAGRVAYLGGVAARTGVYLPYVLEAGCARLRRVQLRDKSGPVEITLLPFIRPATVKAALPESETGGTEAAVKAILAANRPAAGMRSVLVAHQLVIAGGKGPETGGSEELLVGGVDNVDVHLFDAYQYVALGHIHRAQNVCGARIRYCGAPLQYAKDEAGQEKTATLVQMDAAGEITVETRPIPAAHRVCHITGHLEALLAPGFGPGQKADDYFFATLTDDTPPEAPFDRLKIKYPNLLGLDFSAESRSEGENAARQLSGKSAEELFGEFFESRTGRAMNETETAVLRELMQRKEEAHA